MMVNNRITADTTNGQVPLYQRVVELEDENARLHQHIERISQSGTFRSDHQFLSRGLLVFFTWRNADGWPVEYVSPNVLQLLGYQHSDFMSGRVSYTSRVHPDDLERVAAEVASYSQNGVEIFDQEYRLLHATGETRWIYDFTVVRRDSHGHITHYDGYILDISHRKHAEEQLRESQDLLQRIIDSLPQAIFWKDRDSVYQGCNRAFATAAGVASPADISGKTDFDLPWKPEEAEFFRQIDHRVMESDSAERNIVEPQLQADGKQAWLTTSKIPLHDAAGRVTGILGTFSDITELKQAEEELRQNQAFMQMLFENLPVAVFVKEAQTGAFTLWNRTSEMIFGLNAAQIIGKTDYDLFPRDQADFFRQKDLEVFERRSTLLIPEEPVDSPARGRRWLRTVKAPIYDNQDAPLLLLGITEDITERKQAEETLHIFKVLVENAPDGIVITDLESRLTYVNSAAASLHGYASPDDMQGLDLTDLLLDLSQQGDSLMMIMEQGRWQGELSHHRQDGSIFYCQTSAFLVSSDEGDSLAIVWIARDITDQKHAEAERSALQQQIIQTQQNTLRELSTPLIPIADQVVILPLIGAIDSQRAQQIIESLLNGVTSHRATVAIVDITGVEVVDTQVANAIIQAARAIKLLGAQVVLTGIRPQIAQTLVQLGVDLRGIVTHSSLQTGITYALAQHSPISNGRRSSSARLQPTKGF